MTVSIRRATVDDASVVADMADTLLTEIMDAIGVRAFECDSGEMRKRLLSSIPAEQHYVLLAQWDGDPVGFAALSPAFSLYANGAFGLITELLVLPGYRSITVGAQLLRECKSFARSAGWTQLEVTTPPQRVFTDARLLSSQRI